MTPSRRATKTASETRRASVPRAALRPVTRTSSPSAFMSIAEVSLRFLNIRGRRDGFCGADRAASRDASDATPKRERAGVARRRRRRGRCGCRFDAAPDAFDFFRTRPRSHAERPLRVWARSGAFRARAARRAAATGDDAGVEVFSFLFFSSRFFFSRLVNTRSRRNLDRGRDARSRGHPRARIGRRRVRDATEHSLSRGSRRARARVAVEAAAAPPDRRVTRPRIPRTSLSREALQVFFLRLVFVFFTHKKPPPRSARSRLEKAHEGDEVDGVGG